MFAPRRSSYRLILPLVALLATAAPALAADGYLEVIPSTALAWGAVNHIDSAVDKVQKLAKVMQIPAPNLLDSIKKESGMEKGINEKGAFGFFAIATKAEKEPIAGARLRRRLWTRSEYPRQLQRRQGREGHGS